MKTLLACTAVVCFALAGCGELRDTMMTAPDRHGHAASSSVTPSNTGNNKPVAGVGEMYITLSAQDTLSSVAKAYNITLEKLIARNRLTSGAKPGDNLIVPNK